MRREFTQVDMSDERPHALRSRIELLEYEVEELKKTVLLIANNGGSPVYGSKNPS